MTEKTRPISWIKAARKDFEDFPMPVQLEANRALTVAAEGRKADNVKPLKGFDSGIMEIVLRHRGDAFRVVYAVQIGVVSEFGKNRTLSERLATRDAIVKHFVIYGILLKLA
ncbi:type II toxin-antitoxin system RelE/ParE family toxin (plasmid) [Methylomonas sp. MS20]|uniref:type II toxin-antitoxin system RelE/ParE family toxin n=1 Tax=Methylomonas sp. MS20 TaxID=3418769 RepID=UPI003CFF0A1F